jgi:ATP-dependent DNA helicase RecG
MSKQLGQVLNSIVIGDVGSGKTIVAFMVALGYLHGLESGEVALLAPTEVLANQHYQSLQNLLKNLADPDSPTTIYSSSKSYEINGQKFTKTKLEKALIELKNSHKKFFWVGTHSLLFKDTLNADLVLIDEQHRFGVQQRQKLTGDSQGEYAHFVSFTATPIPRTLALTFFDSLTPHFLDTLKSRTPIKTSHANQEDFDASVLPKIGAELRKNQKVYVICAKVLDSEDEAENPDEVWSLKKTTEILEHHFPGKVLSVHGKESAKQAILQEFKDNPQKQILVATTVIEVGVDVPSATLAVILNAERFGLSALHQIRGRVGRNTLENNYCILVTPKKYSFIKRLQYIQNSNDGFELAQKDLELRGGGDMIGKVQSGFDDDLEDLMTLDNEHYNELQKIIKNLDINSLPRLQNYVLKESQKVWDE